MDRRLTRTGVPVSACLFLEAIWLKYVFSIAINLLFFYILKKKKRVFFVPFRILRGSCPILLFYPKSRYCHNHRLLMTLLFRLPPDGGATHLYSLNQNLFFGLVPVCCCSYQSRVSAAPDLLLV